MLTVPPSFPASGAARQQPSQGSAKRLKVLVGAYACSPARGSEQGVGWGWVEAISKYHDLWVITAEQWREEIEAELQRRPELGSRLHFHYVPRFRHQRLERLWPPMYLYTYRHQWQRDAFQLAQQLHSRIGFDLVHQLTYVGFRVPGLLWKLGVPFVWGPIGGLEQTNWRLLPSLGVRGALHFSARNLINEWDRRVALAPKRAIRHAEGAVIAATAGIQKEIERFYGTQSTVISEVGLPPATCNAPARRQPPEPLRLLWCGLNIPRKGLPFLFSALELLPPERLWKLIVIGSGPCAQRWQRLARGKRLTARCEFLGQVPRDLVLEQMRLSHALVVSSVYDLTSTVAVEAMANGLPVVCPDHCGFRDAVTDECGIKVPTNSARLLVRGLAAAIERLYDENYRFQLATNAVAHSAKYNWESKAAELDRIYRTKVQLSATGGSR